MNPDPNDPHPTDRPEASDGLTVLRVLCGGLIGGMIAVTAIVVLVVQFALDGQPIAGNAVQIRGLSAVTLAAVGLAVAAPILGLLISGVQTRAGLKKLAAEPTPSDLQSDRGRLLDVFAAATFTEFAIVEGAGIVCALLYHLTADTGLLAAVAALAVYMVFRFPTAARIRRWYDTAESRLSEMRGVPTV